MVLWLNLVDQSQEPVAEEPYIPDVLMVEQGRQMYSTALLVGRRRRLDPGLERPRGFKF